MAVLLGPREKRDLGIGCLTESNWLCQHESNSHTSQTKQNQTIIIEGDLGANSKIAPHSFHLSKDYHSSCCNYSVVLWLYLCCTLVHNGGVQTTHGHYSFIYHLLLPLWHLDNVTLSLMKDPLWMNVHGHTGNSYVDEWEKTWMHCVSQFIVTWSLSKTLCSQPSAVIF